MSKLTKKEIVQICQEVRERTGDDSIGADHFYHTAVIRGYTSDCPGWTGDIAFVVYGEDCFKDIFYKIKGKWTWAESVMENDYEYNKEIFEEVSDEHTK